MRKFYIGDIYDIDGELFAEHDAMIEYITDNWTHYATPIGDDPQLIKLVEGENANLIIKFSVRDNETGELEFGEHELRWDLKEIVHLMEKETANV